MVYPHNEINQPQGQMMTGMNLTHLQLNERGPVQGAWVAQ